MEQTDLKQVLWNGANILRGMMDANEYKNYLLGIIFYKYLSDTYLAAAYDLIEDTKPKNMLDAQKCYEEACSGKIGDRLQKKLKQKFHYVMEPDVIDYINPNESIGLPDLAARVMKAGGKVGVFPISERAWMDMGQFSEMENMLRNLGIS